MRTPRLLVVLLAAASPAFAQVPLDSLKCHTTKDPLRLAAAADLAATLQPEFSASGCKIGKARLFCVPAAVENLTPPAADPGATGQALADDYVCYRLRCPDQPPDREIADRFGTRVQSRFRSSLLCVPARKVLPTTTTLPTTSTTTTSTTTSTLAPCFAVPRIDVDETVAAVVRGQPVTIPVRVDPTVPSSNVYSMTLDDQGVGGDVACLFGCSFVGVPMSGATYEFTYTAPAGAPASVELRARVIPHFPHACGPGSSVGIDLETFPVVDP